MPTSRYDVIMVSDFRFPGGTSTGAAEEIRAQARAGYRTGLMQLKGPVLKFPHPFHPGIRACLDEGLAELLDPEMPVEAALVVARHPSPFFHPVRRPLAVEAGMRLLTLDHPPFDGHGAAFYAVDEVAAHAEQMLGGPVQLAPVGPAVRDQFSRIESPPPLWQRDWHHILDPAPWRVSRTGPLGTRAVIGRHARPDPLKWPDDRATILEVYPEDPDLLVHILGGGPFLREIVGIYPRNWQVWTFGALPPREFLSGIDFFVYYHHSRWVEAFGRTMLESLACGAVNVLPPHFEPLFGEAAVYAEPADVREVVRGLHFDRARFRQQSERGRTSAGERFGPATHLARLRELAGPPRATTVSLPGPRPAPRRVLFMTSNGVGMGHLARMLAVAKRCPPDIEPVFLTLSRAFKVVREQGFPVEHLPFHASVGVDGAAWNGFLCEELKEVLAFYEPRVLLFDGHVPYGGLVEALAANPDLWSAWCRRGLWQHGQGQAIIDRERHFDLVIEPRDLADAFDRGPTPKHRSRTRQIGPIRLIEREDLLSRDEARATLDLPQEGRIALLQLGAGNNYDYAGIARAAASQLIKDLGVTVVVADWPMADAALEVPFEVRRTSVFPLARHLRAFDLAISAVGYNSFHEILLAGVPAVFVPNEHPQQDDQLARARFADSKGLGACIRTSEIYRLYDAIPRLLEPGEARAVRERAARLEHGAGAPEAVRLLEEMVWSRRVDCG